MAEPTPWPLANNNRRRRARRTETYARDSYNFSWQTVSNGTNPTLTIPPTGPYSAGAVNPTDIRTVESVTITSTGTNPVYGNNYGEPAQEGS